MEGVVQVSDHAGPRRMVYMDVMLTAALLFGAASGQGSFVEVLGGPALDRGVNASPVRNGGYVAVGVTRSFGQGGDDVYLVRTDAAGAPLWTKAIGGASDDSGWSVHELADGFIVGGYTRSAGAGGFDFYLVRTDLGGDVQWSRTYGGPGDDYCWALLPIRGGGFLLAGETASQGAGEEDFLVIETDAAGVELWSRTYGGKKGDRCFSVAPADDGGYVLAGQTYSRGAGDRDVLVVKIKANGDPEWSRAFGGAASDVGHCVTRSAGNSFLVTGYTTSFATSGDDPYLVKIDSRGNVLWTRVIPMDGVNHTLTGDRATDGGYFLVGFTDYPSTGRTAALVVKTDGDGQLQWSREVLPTIIGESFGYGVRATADGGCVFTGHTTVGSAGKRDLLLVKVE